MPPIQTATHGLVCRLPGQRFSYFGWPTVARLADGTLLVASSGLRAGHVCPYGKTVLNISRDQGATWSPPRVIQDSLIDDRDAGLCAWGQDKLLVTWFRSDTRQYRHEEWIAATERAAWDSVFATWTDAAVHALCGSFAMLSTDAGATWGTPIRVPVSAPHGPIRLASGDLLYLGKPYGTWADMAHAPISAARSDDDGRTWQLLGQVPLAPATVAANYHEPHVVELPGGMLLGVIRIEHHGGQSLAAAGIPSFSLMQTASADGGQTWQPARPLGFHGSPPHLLRHSSGVLVLTYGYRQAPYGQRVAFSHDDGATWEHDWIIRADGPDGDLGYPSTVELADGQLFTVCYQKISGDPQCSILWSRWSLPWPAPCRPAVLAATTTTEAIAP